MGLTIHYSLKMASSRMKDARHALQQLRAKALDLPFQKVSDLVELRGKECDFEQRDVDDPLRWLLIQAEGHVHRPPYFYRAKPQQLIAFSTGPGEGCEQANFGLARYGGTLETRQGRVRTGLAGWRWSSFCKTQCASDPACGGVENFLRCHLCVVRLLDHAEALHLLEEVDDETGFWQQRDLAALARQVEGGSESTPASACRLSGVCESQPPPSRASLANHRPHQPTAAAGAHATGGVIP